MASSRLHTALEQMPAAAGHAWVEARTFAILTPNAPRGY
jgi:hypothetical protein